MDVAAYVNRYDDLRSQELPARPGEPIVLANMLNALARGVELTTSAQVAPWWQTHVSYAYHWKEMTFDAGSRDATGGASEANDPTHLFKVRSYMNGGPFEFDLFFRAIGSLPQPRGRRLPGIGCAAGMAGASRVGAVADRQQPARAAASRVPGRHAAELYERSLSLRSTWRF